MTLSKFHHLTAGMPDSTELVILDTFGDFHTAALVTIEDLCADDPVKPHFPPTAIVLEAAAI